MKRLQLNSSHPIRRLIPIIAAALIPVSFGMMLGWPSLAYPHLLNPTSSPIIVTLDETSLIAGFLMEGNTLGVIFASNTFLTSKAAICICFCLQIIGWVLMHFSRDVFWFLGSRGLIGIANGCARGQIRRYIKETCDIDMEDALNNYMPLSIDIGLLTVFILGIFTKFRNFAIYSIALLIIGLLIFISFPTLKKLDIEKKVSVILTEQDKAEFARKLTEVRVAEQQWNVFQVIQNRKCVKFMLIIFFLISIQQYSGGPANIVYSQLIFVDTGNLYPKLCSVIYATSFLINHGVAIRYSTCFKRKANLLVSTVICIFVLTLNSIYFHMEADLLYVSESFSWAPLLLLVIYNFFHTFSYAVLPSLILAENVPKQAVNVVSKFITINFSMSAVLSTKIFQICFGLYGMESAYAFNVCVLIIAFVILAFMKDYAPKGKLTLYKNQLEQAQNNDSYVIAENGFKF